ncbi:MAG TPA: c-type cytochrome [Kofleriaceae bacterium]|nr:c-type cytochrome [Kofleriaceae bacterium]
MKLVVVAVTIAAACSSGSATPTRDDPTSVATLATDATYTKLCAPCHGATGTGYAADHAPSLVNPTFLDSASDDYLHRAIGMGRPGTSMPGYAKHLGGPLDDAALDRLVALLRARGPVVKSLPAVGIGDAAKGAPLYLQLCKACHGDTATRGEAPHLANAQFLAIASDAFIKYAIVNGRPGTKMEPFAQKITSDQIDDIVAAIRQVNRPAAPTIERLPPPTGTEPLVINPKGKDPTFTAREDKYVAVDQVYKAFVAKQKMIIIDARPPTDWMRAHITGAVSIPYHDMKRLDEVPNDGTWVIAYCACPHHLSGIVADELRKRGYKHAVVLDEGIFEWQRRNYPVVAAPGVTAPPKEPAVAPGTIQ